MIAKALIPIAGTGSRLAPITSAVPKAMLPLPAGPEAMLPVLHWICAEAAAAGANEVLLIASPWQQALVAAYLDSAGKSGGPPLPERIEIAIQETPAGFGDAVARGRDFVGGEDFMLLLGDHVYIPAGPARAACAAQVAMAHENVRGAATIGVQAVGADELSRVGVPAGEPVGDRLYRCTRFVEKPDPAAAARRLVTPGLPAGQFLAHCGIYIFTSEIFDCLAALAGNPPTCRRQAGAARRGAELQLADAQGVLLDRHGRDYYLYRIHGRAYDTGTVGNYVKAVAAFAEKHLKQ